MRRKNILLWPSVRHFDISMTFYLLNPYVDSIYPSELEIKDTMECSTSASLDTNSKIKTQLYDKWDDFNFSIVNFPYLHVCTYYSSFTCVWCIYIAVIRYARACSTCNHFLVRGSLLTNNLMSRGCQLSRLQAAFHKFYGRYNDLICPDNLSLGHMLCDVFHTNRQAVLDTLILTMVCTVYLNWK
jgi:hypothetical protein